jgi:ribose 5-phosphate isomerase B
MRIAFGSDGQNECTNAVLQALKHVADVEEMSASAWPDFARAVGEAVADQRVERGVVMCWTGTGVAIAANKVKGVRAATAWDPWIAANARAWNDANVLALSMKRTAPDVAVECVKAFLETAVDPTEQENINKLD